MNQKKIDLSVIILNYNTRELTRICLQSVFRSDLENYSMEVIVCDNASSDGTEELVRKEFPDVLFIQNKKNVGFAAGNNPGIRRARGRYILLLNSDTEVNPDTFDAMISFMDRHPKAGAATCKLLLPDGSMDPACHRGIPSPWVACTYLLKLEKLFPKTRLFGEYHQGYKNLSVPHEVDCISGAFFMIPKKVIAEVGGLDEEYFMYAEDIDWAFRIIKSGYQIWFNPLVSVLHKKKQSGRSNILRSRRVITEIYFHQYNWLFYKKHFAHSYNPFVTFCVNTIYGLRIWLLKKFSI